MSMSFLYSLRRDDERQNLHDGVRNTQIKQQIKKKGENKQVALDDLLELAKIWPKIQS